MRPSTRTPNCRHPRRYYTHKNSTVYTHQASGIYGTHFRVHPHLQFMWFNSACFTFLCPPFLGLRARQVRSYENTRTCRHTQNAIAAYIIWTVSVCVHDGQKNNRQPSNSFGSLGRSGTDAFRSHGTPTRNIFFRLFIGRMHAHSQRFNGGDLSVCTIHILLIGRTIYNMCCVCVCL